MEKWLLYRWVTVGVYNNSGISDASQGVPFLRVSVFMLPADTTELRKKNHDNNNFAELVFSNRILIYLSSFGAIIVFSYREI